MTLSRNKEALLSVRNLNVRFHTRNGIVHAVNGLSFDLNKGEALGIVGESGSGKSVSCYAIMGLLPQPPGKIESGEAWLGDIDLLQTSARKLQSIRGKRIGMIFQDPMTSLNPYLRISTQLIEPLLIHENLSRKNARKRAIQALEEVGIHDASKRIDYYPHEFSGGMRQRVMIAMTLITEPEILIADEPTTALDVTVQAQILDIIQTRREKLGTAVIFITHDLAVVSGFCNRVNVMYAGRIVESSPTEDLFRSPKHPYTRALQQSIPALHQKESKLYTIPGAPPNLYQKITGCPFAPRCEFATQSCHSESMNLEFLTETQATACLREQRGELS
jgi:oligopeptide transport system ATP-binding protein